MMSVFDMVAKFEYSLTRGGGEGVARCRINEIRFEGCSVFRGRANRKLFRKVRKYFHAHTN